MQYDYRVVWTGEANQSLSLCGLSFLSGAPKYFTDGNLPLQLKEIKKLPGVQVEKGEFVDPTDMVAEGTNPVQTSRTQNFGVVWKGTSRVRVVLVKGKRIPLENGIPNFDLTDAEVDEVVRTNSYVEKVSR